MKTQRTNSTFASSNAQAETSACKSLKPAIAHICIYPSVGTNKMRHYYLILFALFFLVSFEAKSQEDSNYNYQEIVDKVFILQNGLAFPKHFMNRSLSSDTNYLVVNREFTEDEFNANEYFDILTHINLKEGYLLDYVLNMFQMPVEQESMPVQ